MGTGLSGGDKRINSANTSTPESKINTIVNRSQRRLKCAPFSPARRACVSTSEASNQVATASTANCEW
jgi:hypothetical protein